MMLVLYLDLCLIVEYFCNFRLMFVLLGKVSYCIFCEFLGFCFCWCVDIIFVVLEWVWWNVDLNFYVLVLIEI